MFCLPALFVFAYENVIRDREKIQLEEEILERILNEQPESVDFFHQDRIYLKSERVSFTKGGLVLLHGVSSIQIPTLFSDSTGLYIHARKIKYCPQCKKYRRTPENNCPVCNAPLEIYDLVKRQSS